jgi:hypothetical protein
MARPTCRVSGINPRETPPFVPRQDSRLAVITAANSPGFREGQDSILGRVLRRAQFGLQYVTEIPRILSKTLPGKGGRIAL